MSKGWARLAATMAMIALTGCAAERDTATVAGCAPDAKPANLNFTLKDMNGNDVAFSASKGNVILLDFWATWCGPCKFEIPGFIELYTKYRSQGLQVLGFSVDDPVPALQEYATQMKMNYPVLVGQGREDVQEAFGPMPGLPTTFIIGRDGKICTSHTGFTEKEKFEEQIKALL
jgi:peroxiredoxin